MQVKIFSGVLPHVEVEINRWLYAHPMVRVVRLAQTEREAEAGVDAPAEMPVVTITLLYVEGEKRVRWWWMMGCLWRWGSLPCLPIRVISG